MSEANSGATITFFSFFFLNSTPHGELTERPMAWPLLIIIHQSLKKKQK